MLLLCLLLDVDVQNICEIPYFSGYKLHFFPQINHESGVHLIRGHRHLEAWVRAIG